MADPKWRTEFKKIFNSVRKTAQTEGLGF